MGDLLDALARDHPPLERRIRDETGALRRYVNEYVLCNSCKSPDSLLDRDSSSRIMFLRCQACGASRTVTPIKAGFVARTTRRPQVG